MARIPKTILHLEVDSEQLLANYTGLFDPSDNKTDWRHDQRIMNALLADERLYQFFLRIILPVRRYKMRQEKKKNKKT